MRFALTAALTFLALLPVRLPAQAAPRTLFSASVGLSSSSGGDYEERAAFTFDALAGARVHRTSRFTTIAAASLGLTHKTSGNLSCRLVALPTPETPGPFCAPSMPEIGFATALIGAEGASSAASWMALIGPAIVHERCDCAGTASRMGGTFGAGEARADIAFVLRKPVSLVFSGALLFVPALGSSAVTIRTISAGIRVH